MLICCNKSEIWMMHFAYSNEISISSLSSLTLSTCNTFLRHRQYRKYQNRQTNVLNCMDLTQVKQRTINCFLLFYNSCRFSFLYICNDTCNNGTN